jgi:F0F1-type ATP synthase membrane subunit c/vacuolar-type H+-ATPase subunit K
MSSSEHSGKPAATATAAPTAWPAGVAPSQVMRAMAKYFRANPQVFVLFVICVVLGLGTFIAVLIALAQAGPNASPTGEPSGVIALATTLMP